MKQINKYNKRNFFNLSGLKTCLLLLLTLGWSNVNAQLSIDIETTMPTCNGYTNGIAKADVNGGTAPYQYAWSNGSNDVGMLGVRAGDYGLTVTDSEGNQVSQDFVINEPAPLDASIIRSGSSNVCEGAIGSLVAEVSGGTAPYQYAWSNGSNDIENTNLQDGLYYLTVTDANGCASIATYNVVAALSIATESVDVICTAYCDGIVKVIITGGTAPYDIDWNTGADSPTIEFLPPGDYSVTVTDGNGCSLSTTANVGEPAEINVDIDVDGSCSVVDGMITATATASGGVAPYTYTWSNGTQGQNTSNLNRGALYFLMITDANGCSVEAMVEIPNEPNLVISTEANNIACNSTDNGSATVTVSSGSGEYTYLWSDGQTTATAVDLAAGVYSVTVTDATGCSANKSVEVTASENLNVTTSSINASTCTNDGMANVEVSGGVAPYTYIWSDGQTTGTAAGLSPGTYSVTATDVNGCTGTDSVEVVGDPNSGGAIMVNLTTNTPACNGGVGSVQVEATGGTAPYNIEELNGADLNSLTAGNYTVIVTDANNCMFSSSVTINEPSALSVNLTANNIDCNNTTGNIQVEIVGGTAPYDVEEANGADLNNLTAGTYTVIVTDANGCTETTSIDITGDPNSGSSIAISLTTNSPACNGGTGSVEVEATGGTVPYDVEEANGADLNNLSAGTYTVIVTDATGCSSSSNITISEPSALTVDLTANNINCNNATGSIQVEVIGGTEPYTIEEEGGADLNNLSAGTYIVVVTDANGCIETTSIDVTGDPNSGSSIAISLTTNSPACNGGTGSVEVEATGGTAPYDVEEANGADLNNLSAGTYTVVVTDATGCSSSSNITISEPSALTVDVNADNSCAVADGMITANAIVSGGTAPYSYAWSNGDTEEDTDNLDRGTTYTLTITDTNGCSLIEEITISDTPDISLFTEVTNIECNSTENGSATVMTNCAEGNFTYLWSDGQTTATATDLPAGTYTVTLTDENGNEYEAVVTITEVESINAEIDFTISECVGNSRTVVFEIIADGNIENQTWTFSNGETSTEVNPSIEVAEGDMITVQVEVNSDGDCPGTATQDITITSLNIEVPELVTACKDDDKQIITESNNSDDLTYSWTPVDAFLDGTDTATPTLATDVVGERTVMVTVMNNNGCTITEEVTINITEEVSGDPEAIETTQCEGLEVIFNNGNSGIDYTYDFGDGTSSTEANPSHTYTTPGTYTVTLTPIDENSCAAPIEKEVIVNMPNEAAFSVDGGGCSSNGELSFTNESMVNSDDVTYNWVFSNGETSSEENPIIMVNGDDEIEATLTIMLENGCELTETQTVPITSFDPNDTGLEDIINCPGTEVALNPNANPDYTYTFEDDGTLINPDSSNPSVSLSENNTYNVTVTDASGECSITKMVEVTVPPMIETMVSDDVEQCGDDLVALEASSPQAETIEWFNDEELADLIIEGGDYEFNPQNRENLVYLKFTDSFGCTSTETITVANNDPQVEVMLPQMSLCNGTSGDVEINTLVDEDMLTFTWTPDDEELIDDPTSSMPVLSPTETTTYTVEIENQLGCTIQEEVTIEVSKLNVDLTLEAERDTILIGEATRLNITGEGVDEFTYTWIENTPGLSNYNAKNPDAFPETTTTYTVIIEDSNGCITEREITITVLQSNCTDGFIFFPNAFSPNNDGMNDVLFVRGFSITDVRFIIYNRWGEKVFESNSIDQGWDGSHKGKPVCADVYGYYLEVSCFGGERFVEKGNVTVLK